MTEIDDSISFVAFQELSSGLGHEERREDLLDILIGLEPEELIEFWGDFKPNVDVAYPSIASDRPVDDVAAVISGAKPATLLTHDEFTSPENREIFVAGGDRTTSLSMTQATDFFGEVRYFLGRPDSVEVLAQQYAKLGEPGAENPNMADFHREVGRALGYPEEAVESFLRKREVNV